MNNIKVEGMHCEHCAKRIKNALDNLGVENVNVDLKNGIVSYDKANCDLAQLIEAIEDLGFDVVK